MALPRVGFAEVSMPIKKSPHHESLLCCLKRASQSIHTNIGKCIIYVRGPVGRTFVAIGSAQSGVYTVRLCPSSLSDPLRQA